MPTDAIIIGSGPNGLAAAAVLARAGLSLLILEAADEIGGGARTMPLTLPGFRHDVCSAIHPLAVSSPILRKLPLAEHGLEWIQPDAPLAHPLDGGRAALLYRSLNDTARAFGPDAKAYYDLFSPVVRDWSKLTDLILGRMRIPHDPIGALRFGMVALRSNQGIISRFRTEAPRALFAGIAGHSNLRLEDSPSAAFAVVLGAAGHAVGWPFPRGGSGMLSDAIARYLRTLRVEIQTNTRVNSVDDLPPSRFILCDVGPRELLRVAGHRFPGWYKRKLQRYEYGPGAFKLDYALNGPVPWSAPEVARAGTIHIGGSDEEIAASERAVWDGRIPESPLIIAAQQSLFDDKRAPHGQHTFWAYCHVPNGSTADMTDRIERQIERFAPGFRNRILARSVLNPAGLEAHNPNLVGGDVTGGANRLWQLVARPTLALHHTPDQRILLCSAATPPGGGVHGMCGYYAATLALRRL